MKRTSWMRLISKAVPSNRNGPGKNSAIDGLWNPDSPSAASGRIVARLDRAISYRSKAPAVVPVLRCAHPGARPSWGCSVGA
jgi:hypothetical protein